MNYITWLDNIESTPDLDGCGPILAPVFKSLLEGKKYETAFEWCAGPAWIGMWLLHNGICKTLVTGDINKKTVNLVKKSAEKNDYNIRAYHSDNMKDIPGFEKFDLVVSNPPNYSNIQESHKYGYLRHDLRPSDIDWKIHKNFYKNIGKHLNSGAEMFISEVEVNKKEVFFEGELYDKRKQVPIEDFKKMTNSNELKIVQQIPYDFSGTEFCMLKIIKLN